MVLLLPLTPPREQRLLLPLPTWTQVLVPPPLFTAPLSQMPFLPLPTPRPQLMRHVVAPLSRMGGDVSESMPGPMPDGGINDGVATTRSERLTAVVHRRVEQGRAECERSSAAYCCPPLHRPSPPMHYRCCRFPGRGLRLLCCFRLVGGVRSLRCCCCYEGLGLPLLAALAGSVAGFAR